MIYPDSWEHFDATRDTKTFMVLHQTEAYSPSRSSKENRFASQLIGILRLRLQGQPEAEIHLYMCGWLSCYHFSNLPRDVLTLGPRQKSEILPPAVHFGFLHTNVWQPHSKKLDTPLVAIWRPFLISPLYSASLFFLRRDCYASWPACT